MPSLPCPPPKPVKKCDLPLTGLGVAKMVVTEYCVMGFPGKKMALLELAPEVCVEDMKKITGAGFDLSEPLGRMKGTED